MAKLSFSSQIDAWVKKVKGAEEAVFKESAQEVINRAQELLTQMVYNQPESPNYRRTGFLRASLTASTSSMPMISASAHPAPDGSYPYDPSEIEAVIAGSAIGDTIFAGYVAAYSAFVHYGARGHSPRPWVELAAQQWPAIVADKTSELKRRLDL